MTSIRGLTRAVAFNGLCLLADAMSATGWALVDGAGSVRELAGKVG